MVYLDDKHREEFYQVYHEKYSHNGTWDTPVLAVMVRG